MVYLIHFHDFISPNHPCRHYVGFSSDVAQRLAHHDARLVQVARKRHIPFTLARVWHGGGLEERRLKNCKNGRLYCPICMGQAVRQVEFMTEVPIQEVLSNGN